MCVKFAAHIIPHIQFSSLVCVMYRMQQLEKDYGTLKENDPAQLEKTTNLAEVGRLFGCFDLNCWVGPMYEVW